MPLDKKKSTKLKVVTSLGFKLLAAAITQNDKNALLSLNSSLFSDSEKPAFMFVQKHLRKYGQLPSLKATASNGFALPQPNDSLPYYLERIRDRTIFNLVVEGQKSLNEALRANDIEAVRSHYRNMNAAIMGVHNPNEYIPLSALAQMVEDEYEVSKMNPGLQGITSGYATLDNQTGGFMGGDLFVIVARPWMGKTWIQLQMAFSAWAAGHDIAIITMEMINKALARRFIAVHTGLNPKAIKTGQLTMHGEDLLHQTVKMYGSGKVAQCHFLAGNFSKSVANVDEMIQQLNPAIVFIDAGYLLSPTTKIRESQQQVAKAVVDELKQVAVNRNKPIGVTVQFNRNVRAGKAPSLKNSMKGSRLDLADIGGTDAVGQNADIVAGLRKPPAPYTDNKRVIEMMKVRDGDAEDFATDFSFFPMRFGEVPMSSLMDGGDEDEDSFTKHMV